MIRVFRAFIVRDDRLIEQRPWPSQWPFRPGDVAAFLTNRKAHPDGGALFGELDILIGLKQGQRSVTVPLQPFLSRADCERAMKEPLVLNPIDGSKKEEKAVFHWLWVFRDGLYITERPPQPSEHEEVSLRIKALHFQADDSLRRLREQVSNFAAVEEIAKGSVRRAIADDVKMLVWTRDGGRCVRCGSAEQLHFDHIIPLARGGGDHAENIQILCRVCNLTKSDRLG